MLEQLGDDGPRSIGLGPDQISPGRPASSGSGRTRPPVPPARPGCARRRSPPRPGTRRPARRDRDRSSRRRRPPPGGGATAREDLGPVETPMKLGTSGTPSGAGTKRRGERRWRQAASASRSAGTPPIRPRASMTATCRRTGRPRRRRRPAGPGLAGGRRRRAHRTIPATPRMASWRAVRLASRRSSRSTSAGMRTRAAGASRRGSQADPGGQGLDALVDDDVAHVSGHHPSGVDRRRRTRCGRPRSGS